MAITYYPATGTKFQVRFTYTKEFLQEMAAEVNQRTIKMLEDSDKRPLIDEYAIDFDSELAKKCFDDGVSFVLQILRDIRPTYNAPDVYSGSDVIFAIRWGSLIHEEDLLALDELIPQAVAAHCVSDWYAYHDHTDLGKKAQEVEKVVMGQMAPVELNLYRDINRKVLRNPFSES